MANKVKFEISFEEESQVRVDMLEEALVNLISMIYNDAKIKYVVEKNVK